ncbi:MAG: peroxidase-related enzyme [Flavobacteriales bacterium]|nr:peroxidase-related enzyme [Flavobacteriales bacterium]
MTYIKTIPYHDANEDLKNAYDTIIASRGKLAAIHEIHSIKPESLLKHMDLYMELMYGKSGLSRAQRELIGVIVSIGNKCIYCVKHHAAALNHYWKDDNRLGILLRDFTKAGLTDAELLLCLLAEQLTLKPFFAGKEELIKRIKEQGLSDEDILDATMVVAYFNFVNRLVLGLGVGSASNDEDEFTGYKYD